MSLRKATSRPRRNSAGYVGILTGSNSIPNNATNNHLTPVTFNKSLLEPLKTEIDPAIQSIRTEEKDQIKGLNNRFVSYIENVRLLEQQNKLLETKWCLLQEGTSNRSEVEPFYEAYIAALQKQLHMLENDKFKFEMENQAVRRQLEDFKTKYEQEINKREHAENEFVNYKKEVDEGILSRVNLESLLFSLKEELDFLKMVYEEELKELNKSIKDISVVVEMDNSRNLNMDQIVAEVKAHYESIASRSREETEFWYKEKFDKMTTKANQYVDELRANKEEVAELKRLINRVQREIENMTAENEKLNTSIPAMEARGDQAVLDATARIKNLEDALKNAKQSMVKQIKEYQALLNIKMALDIEITTYRKMLEGEEKKLGQGANVTIHVMKSLPTPAAPVQEQPSPEPQARTLQRQKSNPVVIKTVETVNRSSYN